jgi:hypothetical protein
MSGNSVVSQIASGKGIQNPFGSWLTNALGGKNSVGGQIGAFVGNPLTADPITFQGIQMVNSLTSKPDAPNTPGPAPTLQNATMTALQNELNQELQMRRSNALATGGTGLTEDPSTRTASQTLLGS